MKAVLLDGSPTADVTGARVRGALEARLRERGWQVEPVLLRERNIGACAGDFYCWVRTPGVCNVDDDNRAIAAQLAACDLVVYLTPVTFGGYSSALKRMVDHQIQNVLPFFSTVDGETHHQPRYRDAPGLLVLGWADAPDPQTESVFRHLAWRNAINFHARRCAAEVVLGDQSDDRLAESAQAWLDDLELGRSFEPDELPGDAVTCLGSTEIRRALLLIGSPRTRKSTSNTLGGQLYAQLATRGVEVETVYLHTVVRSPARMRELFDAVDSADLVTLAFPVYVDSLPAPVIEVLERVATHRRGRTGRTQLFTAIANCGFPETRQTETALAICRAFALQAGFEWAGSLALGGGEAVGGAPLTGGKTARIRKSLENAAEALAQGRAIPDPARDLMARSLIPHWAYRLTGTLRWRRSAARYGVRKLQRGRPYAPDTTEVRASHSA